MLESQERLVVNGKHVMVDAFTGQFSQFGKKANFRSFFGKTWSFRFIFDSFVMKIRWLLFFSDTLLEHCATCRLNKIYRHRINQIPRRLRQNRSTLKFSMVYFFVTGQKKRHDINIFETPCPAHTPLDKHFEHAVFSAFSTIFSFRRTFSDARCCG